jgi:hypothetical protein
MSRSRQWQIFVAPGEELDPLPIASSPWHDERWVRIPKEHWSVILDFAASFSQNIAEKLDACTWAADNNENDIIDISQEDTNVLVEFLENLRHEIEISAPLMPEATDEVPDAFVNEEYVRMLDAVVAVFRESCRQKKPFRAWVE